MRYRKRSCTFTPKHQGLMYIKGAYISDEEIEKVCHYICEKYEATNWGSRYKISIDIASLQVSEEDTIDVPIINTVATALYNNDKVFAKMPVMLYNLFADKSRDRHSG